MIKELEKQSEISDLTDKINEIIKYLNEKEIQGFKTAMICSGATSEEIDNKIKKFTTELAEKFKSTGLY